MLSEGIDRGCCDRTETRAKMNVREIAKEWLESHGFDGLCCDGCGCELSDLMPCEHACVNCIAGHKVPCPGPEKCDTAAYTGDCPWHISKEKP